MVASKHAPRLLSRVTNDERQQAEATGLRPTLPAACISRTVAVTMPLNPTEDAKGRPAGVEVCDDPGVHSAAAD